MHRQSLNHHLDLDCPVLHGDGARASDAGSSARSSIQSGPRRSDAAPEGAAAARPSEGAAAVSLPTNDGAAAPARPSDASRYAACPVCSESVLVSDMNYHLELKCMGSTAEAPAPEPGAGPIAADAIGACPMCDIKMSLREIADHIDAGCPRLAAAAPSPPRESRVLDDLRQGASCPLCMDVLDDPHCLPCAHAFCMECILRAFQTTRPGHGHECPVCRAPCRKRSIQPAAQLRALVDIVRAADAAAAPAEAEAPPSPAPPSPAPPSPSPPPPAPAAASPPAASPSPVAAPSTRRPRATAAEAHALPSADEMAAAPQSPEEVATLERVRGNLARALAAEPPDAASPAAPPSPTPPSSPLIDRAGPLPAKSLLARRRAAESAPDEESPPPAATPTDPVAEPSPAPSPAPSRSPSPEPLARRRPRRAAARSSDDAALAARLQDSVGPPTPQAAPRKKRRRRRK